MSGRCMYTGLTAHTISFLLPFLFGSFLHAAAWQDEVGPADPDLNKN
jgi:hypothetical protein